MLPGPPVRQAPARLPQRTTPAARAGHSRREPPRSRRRLVQRPQTASTLLGWTDVNAAERLFVNALAHAGRGGETGTPTRTASTEQETGVHAGRRAAWGHNTECGTRAAAGRLKGCAGRRRVSSAPLGGMRGDHRRRTRHGQAEDQAKASWRRRAGAIEGGSAASLRCRRIFRITSPQRSIWSVSA
jgi:hypothetical protein